MYKVCVFDIDGVLNPAGEPVQRESIHAVEQFEALGLQVSYASGKHPWYITGGLVFSGLLRKDTVIIGEAGGHVFFPREKESLLYTTYLDDIKTLRRIFYEQTFPHAFWEEPKETLFSLFPRRREDVPLFAETFEKIISKERLNAYVITHVDAVDVMQKGLSKQVGLDILGERLHVPLEEMIAFGDGMNDFEMLSSVGYPVAVGNAEERIKKVVRRRGGYVSHSLFGEGVVEAAAYIMANIL